MSDGDVEGPKMDGQKMDRSPPKSREKTMSRRVQGAEQKEHIIRQRTPGRKKNRSLSEKDLKPPKVRQADPWCLVFRAPITQPVKSGEKK